MEHKNVEQLSFSPVSANKKITRAPILVKSEGKVHCQADRSLPRDLKVPFSSPNKIFFGEQWIVYEIRRKTKRYTLI